MSTKAAKKLCFDKILPRDLNARIAVDSMMGRQRAIAIRNRQWPNGSTLTVYFMGGDSTQQAMVREIMPEWSKHANIRFNFTTNPGSQVRISFDPYDGAWSYIGLDNLEIPVHAATLNLGWVDKSVILHETGHCLGLAHEHQNPSGGLQWNEAAVIEDLSGAPNYWDVETIRSNVLEKYSADQIIGTTFDPQSIMLYAFPASWTTNGIATNFNEDLSMTDKSFIGSSAMYPGAEILETQLPLLMATQASIGVAGEKDDYSVYIPSPGFYIFETSGATDVFMYLYGPDSKTKLVAQNDDSGYGSNARIAATLQPGHYYLRIRHYRTAGTGSYKVWVVG